MALRQRMTKHPDSWMLYFSMYVNTREYDSSQ